MERLLMTAPNQPLLEDEEDYGIDMAQYRDEQQALSDDDAEEGTIDMEEYAKSQQAQEATWWDSVKEAGFQSAAGLGQAFTWPLDVLKMAMVGEGLTDIDELESAFEKAGKPFDRDKYVQTVLEQGEFIPTQALLERKIDEKFGTSIENPKTKTGKFFNKLFFLGGLLRGKGWGKALAGGAVGATTTAALREAGAPEIVSELAGDITGGAATLEKQARKFTAEQKRIIDLAEKKGLPLMEFMLEDTVHPTAKITPARKAAFEKELGMSTEDAIQKIIQEEIPVSKLRAKGQDLKVLEEAAYDKATQLAQANPVKIDPSELVSDIDREISRIKSLAPSPSDAQKAAIRILESEKDALAKGGSNTEQLINQTRNYNSNVKGIYKKAEYSGIEDEVKNAYAFLNDRIRNTIEKQAGKEVIDAHKAANAIYGQNAALARTEGLINKAFKDEKYSAKKLNQLLNSRQGAILRRDIGEEGVKELRQIAEYGERAQKATTQYANSAKHKFKVGDWGPLAGFLLAKLPPVGAAAAAASPLWGYVKGWALTRPLARKTYSNIVKNAANGSFSNMAKDFATLESEITKEFGSVDDFLKQGISELQFYREGEEDEG